MPITAHANDRHRSDTTRWNIGGASAVPHWTDTGCERAVCEDAIVLTLHTATFRGEQYGTISVGCQMVGMNAMGLLGANRVFIEPKAGESIDDVRCVERVRHLRAADLVSADRSALAHRACRVTLTRRILWRSSRVMGGEKSGYRAIKLRPRVFFPA